ncbi:aldose epimerase [Bacillus sp. FJAT-25509]|uniref:aldose epimerase family protein n=1 Tax=Bacillus sp. FJAT-25509 TaxID=1712029 RepID=UPI0006F2336D|nr:aldose epimerase family protein [Bacillus sp. FJAT-25509]KQL32755.1 aldose epimerase [Bacillus sp. FJAT-25509]
MQMIERLFGNYEGESVKEYTLYNNSGMSVSCLNYGCVISKIMVPDHDGIVENVVLGFDNFNDYLKWSPYFGAIVGRVAGRIKGASFDLDGKKYSLVANDDRNHLHGGKVGLSSVIWKTEKIEEENAIGLKFFNLSHDGEEGYPGNLDLTVSYLLTNDNELKIKYEGKTDKKTLVNLTNHSYFNLSGNLKRDCLEHMLQLETDYFLELSPDLTPTGRLLDVKNTPFDFKQGRKLKNGIQSSHPQNVLVGHGYDHPIVCANNCENIIMLWEEESGRTLRVTTDQPCVVLYSGNQLEGPFSISDVPARKYLGVCLETQGYPDAINHPEFPSIILEREDLYYSTTKYQFLCR